ncbi:MAG: hypothetical protein M1821_007699 [Bathelium mastoideum]|nr:MAG: hypothetical protein M1821_007699 [Bathelium mastoideum]
MDLASSIIAVASLGVKLSTTLYSYSNGVVKAEKDITDIAADVALTSNVLNKVGDFMKQHAGLPVASDDAVRDAQSIIQHCKTIFAQIEDGFSRRMKPDKDGVSRTVSIFGQVTWPLKGKRVELLCRKLDGLKLSLLLLLEVLSLAANINAQHIQSPTLEAEREKIRQLYARQQQSKKEEQFLTKEVERLDLGQTGDRALEIMHENKASEPSSSSGPISLPRQQLTLTQEHKQPIDTLRGSSSLGRQPPSSGDDESSEEEDGDLVPALTAAELEICINDAREMLSKMEETLSFVLSFHPMQNRSKRRLRKAFAEFRATFSNVVLHDRFKSPRDTFSHQHSASSGNELRRRMRAFIPADDINLALARTFSAPAQLKLEQTNSSDVMTQPYSNVHSPSSLDPTSTIARPRTDKSPLAEDQERSSASQVQSSEVHHVKPRRTQSILADPHPHESSRTEHERMSDASRGKAGHEGLSIKDYAAAQGVHDDTTAASGQSKSSSEDSEPSKGPWRRRLRSLNPHRPWRMLKSLRKPLRSSRRTLYTYYEPEEYADAEDIMDSLRPFEIAASPADSSLRHSSLRPGSVGGLMLRSSATPLATEGGSEDIVEQLLRRWTTLAHEARAYNNPPDLYLLSP